jgi:hypothetical protein
MELVVYQYNHPHVWEAGRLSNVTLTSQDGPVVPSLKKLGPPSLVSW